MAGFLVLSEWGMKITPCPCPTADALLQACLDVVLPYVVEREQFGKAIGEFQVRVALRYAERRFVGLHCAALRCVAVS